VSAVALSSWISFYNLAIDWLRRPAVVVGSLVLLLHLLAAAVLQLDLEPISLHPKRLVVRDIMLLPPKASLATTTAAVVAEQAPKQPEKAIEAPKPVKKTQKTVKQVTPKAAPSVATKQPAAKAAKQSKASGAKDSKIQQEVVARLKDSVRALNSEQRATAAQEVQRHADRGTASEIRLGRLSSYLGSLIVLPEYGETVLRLRINSSGQITAVKTISTCSKANLSALQEALVDMQLPRTVWQHGDPEDLVVTLIAN